VQPAPDLDCGFATTPHVAIRAGVCSALLCPNTTTQQSQARQDAPKIRPPVHQPIPMCRPRGRDGGGVDAGYERRARQQPARCMVISALLTACCIDVKSVSQWQPCPDAARTVPLAIPPSAPPTVRPAIADRAAICSDERPKGDAVISPRSRLQDVKR
jgi:hypothetical protein